MKKTNTSPSAPLSNRERIIFVRHTYKRMDEAQLRSALASVPDDDPRLVAIHQLIDEELAAAMLEAANPNLDPAKGTHPGGRVDALATLKGRIAELRK